MCIVIQWSNLTFSTAHVIRNRDSIRHRAVCALKSRYRWCLTGTPIQNKIDDYGALLSFLRVSPFTSKSMFDHYITGPITAHKENGIERLKKLVQSTSLRRTKKSELDDLNLPLQENKVQTVEFTKAERDDYNFVKEKTSNIVFSSSFEPQINNAAASIFPTIMKLRQVCNNRRLLPSSSLKALDYYVQSGFSGGICPKTKMCSNCSTDLTGSSSDVMSRNDLPCCHLICNKCMLRVKGDDGNIYAQACRLCSSHDSDYNVDIGIECENSERTVNNRYEHSSKVFALIQNLQKDRSNSSQCSSKR